MVVLGVLLVVVVVVIAVSIIIGGQDPVSFTLLGISFDSTAGYLYILGLLSVVVAVLGLLLVLRGMKRQRHLRKENKTLKKEVRQAHEPERTASPASTDDHFDSTPREHP
ncbi:hypothetical protein [Solicola sp. PLA-1-18]|uniref:hypothetical protein n=1 Tax=Solicola sp. PLA-1-18 TaxID=3380532 RepID=UPI003B8222D6